MTRRFLVALVVAVGLVGCGGSSDNDKAKSATDLQNVTITRNPDGTFTAKTKDQTLDNISSFKVQDENQSSSVQQFLAAPDAAGGNLCCNTCSLSGGVLICTGCVSC
jgi:hypothetical protein